MHPTAVMQHGAISAMAFAPKMPARGVWSADEHDRFLSALKRFPDGPWQQIARCVGTRTVRQVQTHAQKFFEKIYRRQRGLQRAAPATEHRLDDDVLAMFAFTDADDAEVDERALGPAQTDSDSASTSDHSCGPVFWRANGKTHGRRRWIIRPSSESSTPVSVLAQARTSASALPHTTADADEVTTLLPSIEESLDFFLRILSSPSHEDDHQDAYIP